jgi:diacylglycerol kinase (ATP)
MTTLGTSGVLLLHHPTAGTNDDHVERDRLVDLVDQHGLGPVEYREWADESASLIAADDRFVVISGGDGTVASALLAGADRRLPIGILPSGTANNIARSLDIDVDDLDRAARVLEAGRASPFDLPTAGTLRGARRFVESVAVGLLAEVIERADSRGDLDLHEARMLMIEVLTDADPWSARVVVDGVVHDRVVLGIQVMNIGRAGPGIVLASDAHAGTGTANVVLVEEAHRSDLLHVLEAHLDDDSEAHTPLPRWSGEVVTVDWVEPVPMAIDDTLVREGTAVTITYEGCPRVPVLVPWARDVSDPLRVRAQPCSSSNGL